MSLPSYQLSKGPAGTWICSGAMPITGSPFKFDTGQAEKKKALAIVTKKLKHKVSAAAGSRKRWELFRAKRAAGIKVSGPGAYRRSRPAPAPAPEPVAAVDDVSAEPEKPEVRTSGPSDAAKREKLLGLGNRPVPVDQVIPPQANGAPAGAAGDPESEPDEVDEEGQELIASLIAKGATLGLVGLVNARLKKRKPPQTAEPHEQGLKWFHDGLETHLKTLLGRTATLGPTAKIFAGAAVIVGSMYLSAEPINPDDVVPPAADSRPPPPPPPPPPSQQTAHNNGAPPVRALQLGVFGIAPERKN